MWNALSFPAAVDAKLYNSTFQPFNVSAVINPDFSLDEKAWQDAQPLLLTPFFAVTYGVSFAVLTSAVSTVLLWHRRAIVDAFKSRQAPPDEHVELLERNYLPVPRR